MQTKSTLNPLNTYNFSTWVCGTPNEHDVSTKTSVVESGTNASIGETGALSGCVSYKHHTLRYILKINIVKHTHL